MANSDCTACNEKSRVVLSCSGAADLGAISDLTARKLSQNEIRKMSCLALVGASIESSIDSFRKSDILMIDGCSLECGKKALVNHGISDYKYLKISDLGLVKGETKIDENSISIVYNAAVHLG